MGGCGVSGFVGARHVATHATDLNTALRAGMDAEALAPLVAACAAELASLAGAVRSLPRDGE